VSERTIVHRLRSLPRRGRSQPSGSEFTTALSSRRLSCSLPSTRAAPGGAALFAARDPSLGVVSGHHSLGGLVPPGVLDELLDTLLRDLGEIDPQADEALPGAGAPDLLVGGGVIGDGRRRLPPD